MANSSQVPGVYRAILKGNHERGTGGILYVRGELCAYRFPTEFPDPKVCERLEEVLAEDNEQHFYVLEDKSDGQLHLLAYPRDVVRHSVANALAQQEQQEQQEAIVEEENSSVEDATTSSQDSVSGDGKGGPSGQDPAKDPGTTTGPDLDATDPA